jgi:tight adherence protein B
MKRRVTLATALAAVAVLGAAVPASAAGGPRLTPLTSVRFPDRAYVLAIPTSATLNAASIEVRENGREMAGVSDVPAQLADSKTFGVMLAVDASDSMRGKPISAAMAAARAFASQRATTQSLGLILFNDDVRVVLEPTTDAEAIEKALASIPELAVGTRLYDGASQAVDVLRAEKIRAGSVVLLTDGRDIGSTLERAAVVRKARGAGVRLFTVGLRSPQFSPASLSKIARGTGAAYTEAGSSESLARIYRGLSRELSREYLVRYRSVTGPDVPVRVTVAVAGIPGTATAAYRTPALPSEPAPPFHRSLLDRFLSSPLGAVVVALFVGALAWLIVSRLTGSRGSVRRRIGAFTTEDGQPATPQQASIHGSVTHGFQMAIERMLARGPWWDGFKEELEIARIKTPAVLVVLLTAAATVLTMVLLAVFTSPLLALAGLAVPFVVRDWLKRKLGAQQNLFAEQLADNLTVMSASLRAGHSFVGALSAVVSEADEPSKTELRRAVSDEQFGVPVEDALLDVARRMDNRDLEQIALVAALHRQTGGNTAQVLDTVVETIRERFALRRLVRTLTAQGRLARWILTGLPIALAGIVALLNPGYLSVLFTTTAGQVLLIIGGCLLIAGSLMIRRIVDIEL